ncbi:MAG: S8 family serine peptidase, partial [Betaproteobacteria bacterium]
MSGSSSRLTLARRLLVACQILLMVAALFAPVPAMAADPSADPSPTPSADATPTPTPDATPTPTPTPSASPTPTPTPELATDPYIVTFVSTASDTDQAALLASVGAVETGSIPQLHMRTVVLPPSTAADAVATLDSDSLVARVDADRTRVVEATPSDTDYGFQWSLPQIGWDQAYGTVAPAGSATVAVLDTGIDASHPDLVGNVLPGTSILDGSDGLTDSNGHGTWMAGIVAAQTDNGQGIAGVGYAGVKVMPVTVLGPDGTGQDSDVIAGVVWAVDHGADVILMAFSANSYSVSLQAAIDYAWSNGAVLVAATGNDGSSVPAFPAGDRGVIGVSNTDQSDALNPSSNYGQDTFLGAPGTAIQTTDAGGGYSSVTGTSASAAEVAAAAALLKANDPGASNGVIVGRLARNADAAGTVDQTGNGRLNLGRALLDTSTDAVQPVGAAPFGSGGPFVGPYLAATTNITTATIATRDSTCTSSQSVFISGETTCARVVVTGVGGGGGAGSFFVKWTSPSSVSTDDTFTVPASIPTTFDDAFTPSGAGTWTVSVCKTTGCSGGNLVTSTTFTVSPPATHLAFGIQPSNAQAGATIAPAVTIRVLDASNTLVGADNSTKVTLAIGANPGGGALTGGSQLTVSGGVATFSGLSINNIGTGYTLTATDTTGGGGIHPLTGATSSPFNVTVRAITIAAAAGSKTYDGTVTSSGTPTITIGSLAPGDAATLTQTFDSKNVGTTRVLTPAISFTIGSASNYSITLVTQTNQTITARPIEVTADAGQSK